jgi:hypothetical protein
MENHNERNESICNKELKCERNYMSVSNPVKKDSLKPYIEYTVVTDQVGKPIFKRFSDFFALREKLVERWPGIYIPNIPHKKMVVIYIFI